MAYELEGLRYEIQFRRGSENLAAAYLCRSESSYDSDINNDYEHFEGNVYHASEEKEYIYSVFE